MIRIMAAGVLVCVMALPAFAQRGDAMTVAEPRQAIEQVKIDYLIASVAALHDAVFIRNGVGYDAAQAAAHLRMKLRFAGPAARTAEGFITCCATRSSMTAIKYTIRFRDGQVMDAAVFLRRKLAQYGGPASRDNR